MQLPDLAMPSHLTQSVFRQLLSNKPLKFRCPRQSALLRPNRNTLLPITRLPQRRTLFGFSKEQPREPRDAELDPGLDKMLELTQRGRMQARPPPATELVQAWRTFFRYKMEMKADVKNILAKHVLRTFKHLQTLAGSGEEALTIKDLQMARTVLAIIPEDGHDAHQELARLLYAEFLKMQGLPEGERRVNFTFLVNVLAHTGASAEARDLLRQWVDKFPAEFPFLNAKSGKISHLKLWECILSGFVRENNEEELLKSFDMFTGDGLPYTKEVHEIMCIFFASKDDIVRTKDFYSRPIIKKSGKTAMPRNAEVVEAILQFCIRNNELEWCKTVFKDLVDNNPVKRNWDVILRWAAGVMGKGVEDVGRMIQVMIQKNVDGTLSQPPDIETINGLVDLAMSQNNPYLAERYLALGFKFGIQPNARTLILQMDYRTSANDLPGAQAAYEALRSQEIVDNEDLPAINKYIRALCLNHKVEYNRIKSILADLDERDARLEAYTVSSLSTMYLERNETDNLVDLLHINSFHYTIEERQGIANTFRAFCLDRNNTTVRVWHAYNVMRQVFDETSTEVRTQIMNEFFFRGRCDMACHVFGHMRQHDLPAKRPVLETYIQCFVGIAQCAEREYLDTVHNMMKMDLNIEPNTKLYNALMMAYTACDDAHRALQFWDDITNSDEGPSHRSLEIVFWVCGSRPFGDKRAREIWEKMRRLEVEVTGEVWAAYVGALAGQGKLEEAMEWVEKGEAELGLKPTVLVLGTFYNALPGQNRKDIVEKWARENYPALWEELEKLGQTEYEEGYVLFNMMRNWNP